MAKIKPKYQAVLDRYLAWTIGCDNLFMPIPLLKEDPNALQPEVIMRDWESQGIKIPDSCTDPLLLARYIQGKTLRDWHITEWRNGVKEGFMFKEEFIENLLNKGENPDLIFKGIENDMSWYYATIVKTK
jgi:hypothetical protein